MTLEIKHRGLDGCQSSFRSLNHVIVDIVFMEGCALEYDISREVIMDGIHFHR